MELKVNKIEQINTLRIKQMELVREAFTARIMELPLNPDVNRINKRCFTVHMRSISKTGVISPYFHDFFYQYGVIRERLLGVDVSNYLKVFREIIETGKVANVLEPGAVHKTSRWIMLLNPGVIEHLKTLL